MGFQISIKKNIFFKNKKISRSLPSQHHTDTPNWFPQTQKMEPNDNQFSSYFHHHHHHQQQQHQPTTTTTTAPTTTAPPTNGLLSNTDGPHILYPHSVPSAVSSQLEPAKRKRGRPRKYGTPEQALAAKKASTTTSSHSFSSSTPREKKHQHTFSASASASASFSPKKSHSSFSLGSISIYYPIFYSILLCYFFPIYWGFRSILLNFWFLFYCMF